MHSLLTKAEYEKRSISDDKAKQFDELRPLNAEIARYEVLAGEERSRMSNPVQRGDRLSNKENRLLRAA
ncbi:MULTISPECIES: hypothetical protein [Photorhabdus]|uniref:Phage-like protein n=1 Tax=Photorhabdus asymbiotica subsp. asymbiotica (strain ATCC 43949 / 3105-77) TaxID=553480 RepID=C7BIZ9_PHOAA|nr:hypothetical protein [Photorhabdus asymbiotica]CAQ82503.1 phage-like protein [Photorhabdus asymbiotica]